MILGEGVSYEDKGDGRPGGAGQELVQKFCTVAI